MQCWARSVELAGLSHIRVEPEIMIGITNRFIVPVGYCQAIDLAISAVLQQSAAAFSRAAQLLFAERNGSRQAEEAKREYR